MGQPELSEILGITAFNFIVTNQPRKKINFIVVSRTTIGIRVWQKKNNPVSMENIEGGNQRELTALALYHQHNEHPTTCKDCNHLDSNLQEHQKDQKLFFPEIPTTLILQCPFQMQQ
ncbi:hypothetical protein CR513_46263, partial [Mucuna pruriens]